MIVAIITVNEDQVVRFESRGHASTLMGLKGENLVCAAVSVLTQSLYLYCKKEGLLTTEFVKDGEVALDFVPDKSQKVIYAIDLIVTGLENLQQMYPEELELIYKQN